MEDEDIIKFVKERVKKKEIEEVNEELKKWMEEHGIKEEKKDDEKEIIEGKCEICEIRDAKYRCIRCGKVACLSCFWTMLGICKECITEQMMKEWKEQRLQ